jgi:uncharacterized iron-regulated membrane protein
MHDFFASLELYRHSNRLTTMPAETTHEDSGVTSSNKTVDQMSDEGSGETVGVQVADSSRRWRSVWRLHFYSGMFAMPFVVFMALSGLVILYTQPLQSLTAGHLYNVGRGESVVAYELQARAAQNAFPKATLTGIVTPASSTSSSIVSVDDGSKAGQQVFVNPYTGKVLGTEKPGSGLVGLANRLHGYLNVNTWKLSLPTVSAIWDGGKIMRPYVVGDMVLEIFGGWTLVLVLSGFCLWWPRRSRIPADRERLSGKRRRAFTVRLNNRGRAKWRDLHSISGVVLLSAMLLTVISGMAWSTYWGPNFTALANKISPNSWTDAPPSVLGKRGDLDVLGNQIPWNSAERPIPASYATKTDGTLPAALSLSAVVAQAEKLGMKPGYTINFPKNVLDAASKQTVYGSFGLSNSWPRKTNEARDVYLDQFSGKNLAEQNAYGYGAVSYTFDSMVSTHMGSQFGVLSRIMMTLLCVLTIWSVFSALMMFRKRRRPGTVGLPRRPVDSSLSKRIVAMAMAMGVVFPLWGACAAMVLAVDRFVIRRNRRLRLAFGQR